MKKLNESRVIVALDFPRGEQAVGFVDRLQPNSCRLKVGKELFTREGPALVRRFVDQGHDIFLDLKFHDIPNTVAEPVAAASLGVWMLNVHASGEENDVCCSGGSQATEMANQSLLIAVTVLTSMGPDDLESVGVATTRKNRCMRLAT